LLYLSAEGDNHRYSVVKLKGISASFTTTQEDTGVDKSSSNYMNTESMDNTQG